MQNACYCLFSTDLNKIFHMKDVYMQSTRENNSWIYKNDPVQKFTYTWFLILCCYLNDSELCFFCLVIVVHESLVCPEQLKCLLFFRKIIQVPQILWFSSRFVYWALSNNDCMILRSIFSHRGQVQGLICNNYRRFKRSLMLQKEKICIKIFWTEWRCVYFSCFA